MRSRAWLAVVPLLAVLFALSSSVPGVPGRSYQDKTRVKVKVKDPKDLCMPGCQGSACPVFLYATYGSGTYCSYYAELCTGDPADLYNVLVDDKCGHTCNGPYCCAGQCDDCIPIGSFFFKKKQGKTKVPHTIHNTSADLQKNGLTKRGDPLLPNPIANRKVAQLLADPVLAELETQKGKPKVRVLLFLTYIDPSKETDPDKIVFIKKMQMKPRVFGTGLEVEVDASTPTATIPYDDVTQAKGKVLRVKFDGVIYQVIVHNSTDVDPK